MARICAPRLWPYPGRGETGSVSGLTSYHTRHGVTLAGAVLLDAVVTSTGQSMVAAGGNSEHGRPAAPFGSG